MHSPSLTMYLYGSCVYVAYARGREVGRVYGIPFRETAQRLIPTIAALLADTRTELTALRYIACHRGPGSFTTIRSMVVTANGISFVTGIPLIGLESCPVRVDDVSTVIAAAVVQGFECWHAPALRMAQLTPLYTPYPTMPEEAPRGR